MCPVGTVGTQLRIITAEFRGTAQLIDFTGIYPGMPLQVFNCSVSEWMALVAVYGQSNVLLLLFDVTNQMLKQAPWDAIGC